MPKSLIITEKPSVASDIAKAVGGFKKGKDYYENEKYVISWAVGHLFELAVPASMKDQDKWDMKKLPIMPAEFALEPAEKMTGRANVLRKLIRNKDVSELINACDAGREGELIFRYIIQYAGTKKPIKRVWLQSMTREAIRDGFARLRSDAEMQPLASAARTRSLLSRTTGAGSPTIVASTSYWSATLLHPQLPGVSCGIAVATTNPVNTAAGEGEPVCR